MNRFLVLKVLNLIFLGLLLSFIFFYFAELLPVKNKAFCAEVTSKYVLETTSKENAFEVYNQLYRKCLTQAK